MNDLFNRLDPGFLAPVWLIVGFFAIIAVLLLEIGAQRRRSQAIRLFAAPHLIATLTASVSTAKRLLKRILLLIAVGLLFTALARPHLFFEWREESRTGLDILMAVDCSKSMLTEDVKPSRLERAKLAIADFADRLPDNRLGLIAFAGDAFLQCPLTIDHDAFQAAVRELDTDTIPRPGTDIATAIDQAVLACKSQPSNEKFLILVTDGEDLEGRVLDAAKAAAQSGLKIYTIGVGTPNGDLIPERDDSGNVLYHHDTSGQIVQSKLDETMLRKIAEITGGAYLPLGQRGEGLDQIYNQYIASMPRQHLEERREKVRFERFEWPLGLAILLLMWEFIITERAEAPTPASLPSATVRPPIRRRAKKNALATASLISLGLFSPFLPFPLHAAATDKAERDYKSGKYEDALQNYREATVSQPDRNDLQYNRGDAAYKSGEFNEAEEAFRKTLDTPDLNLQEQTYYNLGNTQYKHGEGMLKDDSKRTIDLWEKALHSYESALKLKNAADTQHNYEVVKKKLEQLKQQQQQQDKNNQSQPNKKDQSDKEKQQQQNQQGQGSGQGNQDPSQQPSNPSQQNQPQPSDKDKDKDKDGQQQQPSTPKNQNEAQQQGRSQERAVDQQDPGVKSRQEAEALLDSLKDDERHITARALNRNGEPPPPPSGKDW